MEIVFEILIELYMELMLLIVPEDKRGKKHGLIAKIVGVLCTLGIIALGVWGIVWIVDYGKALGWLPLGLAIVLSVLQITAGIVLYIRKNKKE